MALLTECEASDASSGYKHGPPTGGKQKHAAFCLTASNAMKTGLKRSLTARYRFSILWKRNTKLYD